MTDEKIKEIEKALRCCVKSPVKCSQCPYMTHTDDLLPARQCYKLPRVSLNYIKHLKTEKQTSETQLKELLSALYRRTDNDDKSFTIYQKDVVGIAKDCGIEEEELK